MPLLVASVLLLSMTVSVAVFVKPEFPITMTNTTNIGANDYGDITRTEFRQELAPAWHAYLVANVVGLSIVLMVQGYRSDFVLFGALCVFGLTGIVDKKGGLEGFMNSGNLTQCLLFVIARAIEQAGILDQFALVVLGQPKSMPMALLRVIVPSALASGVLNSPAVATVMTPIIIGWARRLQMDERALLLPMAIACSFGGSLTVVGCGPALVAGEKFKETLNFDIEMFDITPVAICLLALYTVWALTIGRFLAPRSNGNSVEELGFVSVPGMRYRSQIRVGDDCLLFGKRIGEVGLDRLPGVSIKSARRRMAYSIGAGGIEEAKEEGNISAEGEAVSTWELQNEDRLMVSVTASGMAEIRQVRGFKPASAAPHLSQLGGQRHRRQLIEAVLAPSSPYLEKTPAQIWSDTSFLHDVEAALVAARRPGVEVTDDTPLVAGDVLLIEARDDFATSKSSKDFSVLVTTPNSQPPRDRDIDRRRGYLIFLLLLAMTGCAALGVADLIYLTIGLSGICVMLSAVTPQDAWKSVRGTVFLVIGSAFGVGKAMETSGLAGAIARGVASLASKAMGTQSPLGSMIALGSVTAILSNLMSNTATCVLMIPIAKQIIEDGGFQAYTKMIVFTLVYSANASFSTPIATPPNLIVASSSANYTWREFFLFGFPLQLICLPVSIGILYLFYAPGNDSTTTVAPGVAFFS